MKVKNQSSKVKSIIVFLSIAGLVLPSFCSAQNQTSLPQTPESWDEVKSLGVKILDALPQAIKKVWGEAVEIWKKMGNWFIANPWQSWFKPRLQNFWQYSNFKEEFRKELKEIKDDILRIEKIIWQKLTGWRK